MRAYYPDAEGRIPEYTSMKTHIFVVLDRSGSMQSCREATIAGFNRFIREQREVPGECSVTLTQFDDIYDVVYVDRRITDVPDLTASTYVPRASTALLDAIGRTINEVGSKLEKLPAKDRPSKVIGVIITDGQENASQEFKLERVREMINHQRDKYSWDFVYLGANVDAFKEAGDMGFAKVATLGYAGSSVGTENVYAVASSAVRRARVMSYESTCNVPVSFDENERKSANETK